MYQDQQLATKQPTGKKNKNKNKNKNKKNKQKQKTNKKKTFINSTSDRGLIFKIYKEIKKLDYRKSNNPI